MSLNEFKQSKFMTMIESILNVSSGMFIAFSIYQLAIYFETWIQNYIWSGFELHITMGTNLVMTIILTIVSVLRGYCWRRIFNHQHAKSLHSKLKENDDEQKDK